MRVCKNKKALGAVLSATLGAVMLGAIALTGCNQSSTVNTDAAAYLSEGVDSGEVQVVVTAVNSNELTVSQDLDAANSDSSSQGGAGGAGGSAPGEGGQGGEGGAGGDGSTPPDMPEGDSNASQGGADGASQGDGGSAPQGQAPDNAAGQGDASQAPQGDASQAPSGSGEQGDQAAGGDSSSEPPAKPEGDSSSDGANNGESADGAASADSSDAPAKPDEAGDGEQAQSDSNNEQATDAAATLTLTVNDESIITFQMNDASQQGSLDNIGVGKVLTLTVESDGTSVSAISVSNSASETSVENGTGAYTISSDATEDGATYTSTATDENAVRVDSAATAVLTGATVTKTGDASDSESSSFYGLDAASYVFGGSTLAISNSTITTDASGANGVFAYGTGSLAIVKDTTISTSKDNSGGIMCAGGATLRANNLTVETQGESSAAIRSDRGGGTEIVTGGSYTTHGNSSPAVYCTADVTVSNATLSAENAQGVVIEGQNTTTLNDCTVTGNINGSTHRTDTPANVMIYQSMSGDAEEGKGVFNMNGGSFNAEHGSLFWITNTSAEINLDKVEFTGAYDEFLTICGTDEWGTAGSNGGNVVLNAVEQAISGVITVDSISTLEMNLTSGSSFEGCINASGQAGNVTVSLDADSTWTLTADCYITELSGDTSGIDLNGHTLYVNGEAWSK